MNRISHTTRGRRRPALWAALIALAVFSAGCAGPSPAPPSSPDPSALAEPQSQVSILPVPAPGQSGASIADIIDVVGEAVVGIAMRAPARSATGVDVEISGIGTGVIVDAQGYVLTNHHVTADATEIRVILADGSNVSAKQLWTDAAMDLAILSIDGDRAYPFVKMGDSAAMRVGEPVIAIGTPLTLQFQRTVTQGIISAKNRTLSVDSSSGTGQNIMEDLLQTDASINPGNSGGPLVNGLGEVIGINTVKVTDAEGIGFAIPIDVAKPIVQHFVTDGKYTTPYIGVFSIDQDMARFYDDFDASWMPEKGLLVLQVDRFGPGYAAGIRQGDIVYAVDGHEVTRMLDLRVAMYNHKVGEDLLLEVWRENGGDVEKNTVRVRLVASPLGS